MLWKTKSVLDYLPTQGRVQGEEADLGRHQPQPSSQTPTRERRRRRREWQQGRQMERGGAGWAVPHVEVEVGLREVQPGAIPGWFSNALRAMPPPPPPLLRDLGLPGRVRVLPGGDRPCCRRVQEGCRGLCCIVALLRDEEQGLSLSPGMEAAVSAIEKGESAAKGVQANFESTKEGAESTYVQSGVDDTKDQMKGAAGAVSDSKVSL